MSETDYWHITIGPKLILSIIVLDKDKFNDNNQTTTTLTSRQVMTIYTIRHHVTADMLAAVCNPCYILDNLCYVPHIHHRHTLEGYLGLVASMMFDCNYHRKERVICPCVNSLMWFRLLPQFVC